MLDSIQKLENGNLHAREYFFLYNTCKANIFIKEGKRISAKMQPPMHAMKCYT